MVVNGDLSITRHSWPHDFWACAPLPSALTSNDAESIIPCAEWVTIADPHGTVYHWRGNGLQTLFQLVADALRSALTCWGDSPGLRTEALAAEIRLLNSIHSFMIGDE